MRKREGLRVPSPTVTPGVPWRALAAIVACSVTVLVVLALSGASAGAFGMVLGVTGMALGTLAILNALR
jgi:hypothetical protein